MSKFKHVATAVIVQEIRNLQAIQKTRPHFDPEWKAASVPLNERFVEMARRVKAGDKEAMAVRL